MPENTTDPEVEPTGAATEEQQTETGEQGSPEVIRLRREVEKARKDAARARTSAREAAVQEARDALAKELARTLGIQGEEITPEQLQKQLADAQAGRESAMGDALAAQIELTVYRTAAAAGADAERLLDSRAFCSAVDELDVDPTDRKAFTAAVRQLITEHLDAHPTLRATPAAGRSSTTTPPAGAPQARKRAGSLSEAVAARLAGRG